MDIFGGLDGIIGKERRVGFRDVWVGGFGVLIVDFKDGWGLWEVMEVVGSPANCAGCNSDAIIH